ncbi:MAG: helix-turn-helix domain-containing protein [Erysipelotrichaceae bacterium]|nr:helix-turn-helix domain-containing protein [Erysipelotrichaceae bacterium]
MEFSEQIREIRKENHLTQEEMAARLHVTRQAVSNWENGKNLPDIEMLMEISLTFQISLDRLIFGGEEKMNDMAEKLIDDGSEGRRAKRNMAASLSGAGLVIAGVLLFLMKGASVEYIDAAGVLHENFWMIGIGWLLIFAGIVTLTVNMIRNLHSRKKMY